MSRPWRAGLVAGAFVTVLGVACSPGMPAPAGAPVADPAATAEAIRLALLPESPGRIAFDWELREQGSRLSGKGVARYEAPTRLRLDLFGPRGETYLAAGLVGDEVSAPAPALERFTLPSTTLLWAALGVLRPPTDAPLVSVHSDSAGRTVLRYGRADAQVLEVHVDSLAGRPRIVRADLRGRSGVLESVELSHGASRVPTEARYRNWSAFRDLTLRVESARDVEVFPPEIFTPYASR